MFATEFQVPGTNEFITPNDLDCNVLLSDSFRDALTPARYTVWNTPGDYDEMKADGRLFSDEIMQYALAGASVLGDCDENVQAAIDFQALADLIYNTIMAPAAELHTITH